nr:MAG TPA: hypothetical protein [Caudoviricetes sp.]
MIPRASFSAAKLTSPCGASRLKCIFLKIFLLQSVFPVQSLVLVHRRGQLLGQRKRKCFYTKSFIKPQIQTRHERNS